jgi:hypothetical protein
VSTTDSQKMSSLCKFSIGDLVGCIVAQRLLASRKARSPDNLPKMQPMQIIERTVRECPGGVQICYLVRAHMFPSMFSQSDTMAFGTELITVNEIELTLLTEPEAGETPASI